jgi:hypothetical protein
MKVRTNPKGVLIVFPEGGEYKAFKMWLNEFGTEQDYYDVTAGCYMIRSHSLKELRRFGFKIESLTRPKYAKLVKEFIEKNGEEED